MSRLIKMLKSEEEVHRFRQVFFQFLRGERCVSFGERGEYVQQQLR